MEASILLKVAYSGHLLVSYHGEEEASIPWMAVCSELLLAWAHEVEANIL